MLVIFILLTLAVLLRADLWTEYLIRTSNVLLYDEDKQLSSKDFHSKKLNSEKGTVNYSHGFGGVYNSGPVYFNHCFSYFEPDKSWIDLKDEKLAENHLDFQQIIFKLNELYARKLKTTLDQQKDNGQPLTNDEFRSLFDELVIEKNDYKSKIESDERFSSYEEKIAYWEDLINEELKNCCQQSLKFTRGDS